MKRQKNSKKKLHQDSIGALQKKLAKERQNLMQIKMQQQSGKLKDLHSYAKKRKQIAAIATILREKQLEKKLKKDKEQ